MNNKRVRALTDSPCVGRCSTVLGDDVCRGCGRTFEEVCTWNTMSDEEKTLINLRLRKTLSKQNTQQ